MKKQNQFSSSMNRRKFITTSGAAAALSMIPGGAYAQFTAGSKPISSFNGVDIGVITYSWRSMASTAEDLLKYLLKCGITSVELMGGPAEQFAGAPEYDGPPWPNNQSKDEEREAFSKAREEHALKISEWRTSVSMDKYVELRKMYNDAGVDIYIVKLGDIGPHMSTEEVNYCFNVARALGSKGITTEISEEKAEFLGPFADRHEIVIGFHNHTQVNSGSYEKPFSYGKYLAMNFDVGHYVAGTNESPIPLIEKYAAQDRILSLHLKDRKVNFGDNMPFGMGDTPVALILQLMKRNKYTFPGHIELEYPIPEGSDAVAEVQKCVEFCKNALSNPPEGSRH